MSNSPPPPSDDVIYHFIATPLEMFLAGHQQVASMKWCDWHGSQLAGASPAFAL